MRGGRSAGYARYGYIVPYRGAARGSSGRGGRTIGRGGMMFRAKGNMIASKQQRDSATVVLQGMMNVPITVNTQNANPVSNGAVVGLSIWQLLFNTKFWEHYKEMWDQVKMMGFRCRIIGNSAATTVLASGLSSVGVVTAVDRTSIPGGVMAPAFMPDEQQNGNWKPAIILNPGKAGNSEEMINAALSYGSCKTKNWSPGNAFYQWVSCYPSTMNEKEHWIETDNAIITAGVWQGAAGNQKLVMGYPSGLDMESENMALTASGQTRMGSNNPPGFNPVMLLGIYNIPQTTATSAQVFTFSIEYKIPCTFRGARSGNQDAAALVRAVAPPDSGQLLEVNITENGDRIFNEGPYDPVVIKTNVKPSLGVREKTVGENGTTVIEPYDQGNGQFEWIEKATIKTNVRQMMNYLMLKGTSVNKTAEGVITETEIANMAFWNFNGGTSTKTEMYIGEGDGFIIDGRPLMFAEGSINGFIVIAPECPVEPEVGGTTVEKETLVWAYYQSRGGDGESNSPWEIKGVTFPERMGSKAYYATWRWNPEQNAELLQNLVDGINIELAGKWKKGTEDGTKIEAMAPVLSIPTSTKTAKLMMEDSTVMLTKCRAFRIPESIKTAVGEGEEIREETIKGLLYASKYMG